MTDQINAFVASLNAAHGTDKRSFSAQRNRKYTRVVVTNYGQDYVHCFITNATGDILKADGWKRPAKGVRGNVASPPQTDPYTSYLYRR
jgi:hypothetical protein